MATPRHLLVDPVNECDYHLVSRCVRRAFLCGVDDYDGRDYSHRRAWLVERMRQLSPCFAVDIYSYTVLSNHFHLVLRHDPLAHRGWSDEEVARRWLEAFPPTERGAVVEELKPERRELMLGDPNRVARARCTLGSMSHFMKHLKQPIARRANLEDDRTGHFFEQRFYSGALLTEEALIAAMAYVDLNPVRAELAERIEEIRDTSIRERLQVNSAEALADYLQPVVSGLDGWAPQPESSSVAVVAVESQVDGETVIFDLDVASRTPSEGELGGGHAGGSPPSRDRSARRGVRSARRGIHGRILRARTEPGGRARTSASAAASPPHPGRVRRPGAGHGRGGGLAVGGPSGRHEPVAGPDDCAPQAAARLRRRAGAAAVACRPGHAVPGDAPARLRPGCAASPAAAVRPTARPASRSPGKGRLAVCRQRPSDHQRVRAHLLRCQPAALSAAQSRQPRFPCVLNARVRRAKPGPELADSELPCPPDAPAAGAIANAQALNYGPPACASRSTRPRVGRIRVCPGLPPRTPPAYK